MSFKGKTVCSRISSLSKLLAFWKQLYVQQFGSLCVTAALSRYNRQFASSASAGTTLVKHSRNNLGVRRRLFWYNNPASKRSGAMREK
jgi:hypothetical protein